MRSARLRCQNLLVRVDKRWREGDVVTGNVSDLSVFKATSQIQGCVPVGLRYSRQRLIGCCACPIAIKFIIATVGICALHLNNQQLVTYSDCAGRTRCCA